MMKWMLLSLLLVVVVFTSGCTSISGIPVLSDIFPDIFGGNQEVMTSDVITIDSMTVTPDTEIRSGQTMRLIANVKNTQKAESDPQKNVIVRLYNDCGLFDVSIDSCRSSGQNDYTPGEDHCDIETLYPLSTAIVEWKLKANPVNVKTNCKLGIYVEYTYTTHSTSSVTFVNREEAEQWVLQGKSVNEAGSKVIGEGPIKSYVEVKSQPIMVDKAKSGEASGSAIMTFWITNEGSGILETGKIEVTSDEKSSPVKITSAPEPGENEKLFTDVSSQRTRQNVIECIIEKTKDKYGKSFLVLIGKTSPKYSCEIYLGDPNEVKIEKTYEIGSTIEYTYRFIKEKTVTVKPEIEL
jgi:hypothetical protein